MNMVLAGRGYRLEMPRHPRMVALGAVVAALLLLPTPRTPPA